MGVVIGTAPPGVVVVTPPSLTFRLMINERLRSSKSSSASGARLSAAAVSDMPDLRVWHASDSCRNMDCENVSSQK